ncbi:MAG TPA: alpha/beta hydrolase family protein, partial [Terriglobales bacterium]|nr:alpha/beta hydrolase family protein [Terriglobales bacterium]
SPPDYRLETRSVPRGKQDARLEDAQFLRFTSPVATPFPENNTANARWFCARQSWSSRFGKPAVLVLPQWNSDQWGHNALCRIFNRLGVSALRLSMPYHDVRMPAGLERADYAVSSNIARTLDAGRQAVTDIRCCLDWLEQQGYTDFGIIGTSLGSCYAFLASAHERRLRVNAFNHGSTYFGDVVWTGQSTRHIRAAVEPVIDRERLREAWLAISPHSYFSKFARWPKQSLVVYAKYDLTFLPELSLQTVEEFRQWNLDYRVAVLPCGHYTTGETPFKFLDAWHLARFVAKAFR